LRANYFFKKYCKQNKINSVLISLDAKKAFDSVNHKYIEETLRAYGFGESFINIFKLLYKNISSKILVNGYFSESLKIERGVKQGDALSCAIFIICIDPLLRNINNAKNIKSITIKDRKKRNVKVNFRGAAFADDVSVICINERQSIQGVFDEYDKLTSRSGLELNADKTEILIINSDEVEKIDFRYNNQTLKINSILGLKICGLYYCNDINEEYNLNVTEKINKLTLKIKQWVPRRLTMEGKILIVKTFGLSQLIYNMQSYGFKKQDLVNTERIIFKFLWSTNENQNGIDRISRSILKNDYDKGGMKVTDVECLDRSIKLRQFFRANDSNHEISKIQVILNEDSKSESSIKQEYRQITDREDICQSAQESLNIITDYNRNSYANITSEEYETDKNLIDEVSSINLETYLGRKKKVFLMCIVKQLVNNDISTLGELILSNEHVKDKNLLKTIKMILQAIPKSLINIATCFNEEINSDKDELKYILITQTSRVSIDLVTVKQLQVILKLALKKVEVRDFNERLGITDFDPADILKFRKLCKNSKLRNIFFRLIHRDFFTHVRMKKYKMTVSDQCPRCGQLETVNHLLWECKYVQDIWNYYNDLMNKAGKQDECVLKYDNIYKPGNCQVSALIKIKLIQELIQIERPKNWNNDKLVELITSIIKIEEYNANLNRTFQKFKSTWNFIQSIL
jgi:hypothetical protein